MHRVCTTYTNKIWAKFQRPCIKEPCPICRGEGGNQGSEEDEGDEADDVCKRNEEDEEDEEDEGGEAQDGEDKPTQKAFPLEPYLENRSNAHRKENKTRQSPSKPKKSALYDRSVPFSHREGYTLANTTANELMEWWQVYRR